MSDRDESTPINQKKKLTTVMEPKEVLLKEIEIIQNRIEKVEKTSFVIKGWVITMVAAVVALLPEKVNETILGIIVLVSVIAFWYLDAFFLKVDKGYRWKYNWVINNRLDSNDYCLDLDPYNKDTLLNPDKSRSNKLPCVLRLMFTKTLIVFYLPYIALSIAYIVYYCCGNCVAVTVAP